MCIRDRHETSFKQESVPRYHARDLGVVYAGQLGVPILLGSATPSLESLHNAQAGRYAHLRLRHRAGNAKPPHVRVLDVRKRLLHAGLGEDALLAIRGALDAGGQVLVLSLIHS